MVYLFVSSSHQNVCAFSREKKMSPVSKEFHGPIKVTANIGPATSPPQLSAEGFYRDVSHNNDRRTDENELEDMFGGSTHMSTCKADCIQCFEKSLILKVDFLQKWLNSFGNSYLSMKLDIPEAQAACKQTNELEAEILTLQRTSPETTHNKEEFEKMVENRTTRLLQIKSDLLALKEKFKTLKARHDEQCNQIMKTLNSFPFFLSIETEK